MARERSYTWLAVVLSIVFVALAGGLFWMVATGSADVSTPAEQQVSERTSGEVQVRDFAEYSWEELKSIATRIAAASTAESGRELANAYGIEAGSARLVELTDGTQVTATVVGIRADEGTGLTFMLSPIAMRPMNSTATCSGGWEASELRNWLASDGLALLPGDLSSSITPVSKLSNNSGIASTAESVTATTDSLWLFSASEVNGAVAWFTDEYGVTPNFYTDYTDFNEYDALLQAEGAQYEYFANGGSLDLAYHGTSVAWWYRTAYPYSFAGEDAMYFFQAKAGGYPDSVGEADQEAGVVCGFCL